MAEARIALGAELDIASGDELKNGFDLLGKQIASGGKPRRIHRPLVRSATFAAVGGGGGPMGQLFLGRPATSRIWIVTRVSVMGTDDSTSVANVVAALYIGDTSNPSLGQCVLTAQPIPFTSNQNEHAWVVHDRESLFLNITATAAKPTQQIMATVQAWEYRDDQIEQQRI